MRSVRPLYFFLMSLLLAGSPCPSAQAATVGSVHGRVTASAGGQPIADARVALASASGNYATTTDAGGSYEIVGVQPDTYTVSAQHDGLTAGVQSGVTVTQDAVAVVGFALSPESLKEIARVGARSASSPVQPHQPDDVYIYGTDEQRLRNEWGANGFANAYGLNPLQTKYSSGNQAYLSIYSQLPLQFSPLLPPLTLQQTAAIVPLSRAKNVQLARWDSTG